MSKSQLNPDKIAMRLALIVSDEATKQGNVPFDTGELRRAHSVRPLGGGKAVVEANVPYARAVHEGRPPIIIKPRKAKALSWRKGNQQFFAKQVKQPARKGNPWLKRAAQSLPNNPQAMQKVGNAIGKDIAQDVIQQFKKQGFKIV